MRYLIYNHIYILTIFSIHGVITLNKITSSLIESQSILEKIILEIFSNSSSRKEFI